jgi:hypothetical protein
VDYCSRESSSSASVGWRDVGDSGSIAVSGVIESTSRISIEDDGDARVSYFGKEGLTSGEDSGRWLNERFRALGRRWEGRSAGCEWPGCSPSGVYIVPWP